MSPNTAERLWSVADLAEYLGVPIMTVYHWRSSGYGPKGTKIGRYVRYRPADIESWLDEQTRAAG